MHSSMGSVHRLLDSYVEQFRWDELAETEEVTDAGNLLHGRVRL
jgi:hypothetical protein